MHDAKKFVEFLAIAAASSGAVLSRFHRYGSRVIAFLTVLAPFLVQPVRAELMVVTTTPDLKSITEAVSGGVARVEALIPVGSDPEAFEPRPNHLAMLSRAALVVRIGAGYEHWLDRLLVQVGNKRLLPGGDGYLDASNQIALLEVRGRSVTTFSGHAHGSANPHYWLDPANGELVSSHIASTLIRLVPEQQATIEAAHTRFLSDLKQRLARWIEVLEAARGVPLVSYHNTWPYFARRFRLNIVETIEQKEGIPPSVARLANLASTMRKMNVRAILHEPFQPLDASQALAQRTGARVIVLAPSVGSLPAANDYFKMFDYNVEQLAKALVPAL